MPEPQKIEKLRQLATAIRIRDLEMIYGAKLGHIGGDFSVIDILVTLYYAVLKLNPQQPSSRHSS